MAKSRRRARTGVVVLLLAAGLVAAAAAAAVAVGVSPARLAPWAREETSPPPGVTATQTCLGQVEAMLAGLAALLDDLEDISEDVLAAAEEPGHDRHERALEAVRAVRANRQAIADLLGEIAGVSRSISRRVGLLRSGRVALGERALTSLEGAMNSIWHSRVSLRDTVGDIRREESELLDARRTHDWAGVVHRVETIAAIQEVRLEELESIHGRLRHILGLID